MQPCNLIRGKRYWLTCASRYVWYCGAGDRFGEDVYRFQDICDACFELSADAVARLVIEK